MVRDYLPNDLDAVVSLFQRSVHEIACLNYSPVQIAAWAPEQPDFDEWAQRLATGGVFVCEQDKRILGFARIDDTGYLDLLFVHPEAQAQGVARSLLDRVVSWAVSKGIRRLCSDVSLTARRFFERAGFRVVKEQRVERRGVMFDNLAMEKEIGAEAQAAADVPNAARH